MGNFITSSRTVYVSGAVILAANHNNNENEIYSQHNAAFNNSTGHGHSGSTGDGPKLTSSGINLTGTFAWTGAHTHTANFSLYSGADFTVYSDAGSTAKFFIDGATGDFGIAATRKFFLDGAATSGNTYIQESAADTISIVAGGTTSLQVIGSGVALTPTGKLFLDAGGDTFIQESSANNILFQVGGSGTLNLTVDSMKLAATFKFFLDGGGDTYIQESAANVLDFYSGGTKAISIAASGAVTISNAATANSANCQMDSNGLLTHPVSSLKYKKDVVDLLTDSSKLYDVRPVSFKYKLDDTADIGFIAEELAEIIPEMVFYKNGEPESVHYEKSVVLIVAEMKKLKARLDTAGL